MEDSIREKSTDSEPRWVTATLRFLPVPIFAFAFAAACFAIACFCFIMASVEGTPTAWSIGGLFASLSVIVIAANITRSLARGRTVAVTPRYQSSQKKPTLIIFVLLIWVYSGMLMLGLRTYRNFFAAKGNAALKYNLTLGIALASSFYLAIHGRSLLRRHLGPQGGRSLVVTPSQAILITLFVTACGSYLAWLMH